MATENLQIQVSLETQRLQRDAREVLRTTRALDRAFATINPRGVGAVEKELRKSKDAAHRLGESVDRTKDGLTGLGRTAQLTARRFIVYNVIAGFFFRLTSAIREGVGAFVAFDAELNKARQILNPLNTDFAQLVDTIFELGEAYGVSIGEIQKAQETFIRQGKTQVQVIELTKQALALGAAAGLDYSSATEAITAAVNQFVDQQIKAVEVADKFTAVSIRNAVTANDLDQAIRRAGSAAVTVGVQFDNLVGFISAAEEATRRGGNVIGTGLRTIFTRIFRAPAIEALQELGIETRKATGEFRNADDIIADLAKRFVTLNQTQRIAIASTIAGQRQIATFLAVLNNFEKAQKAANDATNSAGEAARLVAIRQQSLEAQLQKITNQFLRFGVAVGEAISDDVLDFLRLFSGAFEVAGRALSSFEGAGLIPLVGTLAKLGAVAALQTVGVTKIGASFKTVRAEAKDAGHAIDEFNKLQGKTTTPAQRAKRALTGNDPKVLLKAREAQLAEQQLLAESLISRQEAVQEERGKAINVQQEAKLRLAQEEENIGRINQAIIKGNFNLRKAELTLIDERNKLDEAGVKLKRSKDNLEILKAEKREIQEAVAAAQGKLSGVVGSQGAGRGSKGTEGIKLERDRVVNMQKVLATKEKIEKIDARIAQHEAAIKANRKSGLLSERALLNAQQKREGLRGAASRGLRDLRADASKEELKAARELGSANIKQLRNAQAINREKTNTAKIDNTRAGISKSVASAEQVVLSLTTAIATQEADIAFIKSEQLALDQKKATAGKNVSSLAKEEAALARRLTTAKAKLLEIEKKREQAQARAAGSLVRGSTLKRGIGAFGISAIFQTATESLDVFADKADKETQAIKEGINGIGGALSTAFLLGGPLGLALGAIQLIFVAAKAIKATTFDWGQALENVAGLQSEINNSLRASVDLFRNLQQIAAEIRLEGLTSANFKSLQEELGNLSTTFKALNDAQLTDFRKRINDAIKNNDIESFVKIRNEMERINAIEGIRSGGFEGFDRKELEASLQTLIETREELGRVEGKLKQGSVSVSEDKFPELRGLGIRRTLELQQELKDKLGENVKDFAKQGTVLAQVFEDMIDPSQTLKNNLQQGLLENFIEEAGLLGTAAERFLEIQASADVAATSIEALTDRTKAEVKSTRELVTGLREQEASVEQIIGVLGKHESTQKKLTQSVFEFNKSVSETELRDIAKQFGELTQQSPDDVFRNLTNVINENHGAARLLRNANGELFIAIDGINGVVPENTEAFKALFAIMQEGGVFTDIAITNFNRLGDDLISNKRATDILAAGYEALASRLDRTTESLSGVRQGLTSVTSANQQIAQSFPTKALEGNADILEKLVSVSLDVGAGIRAPISALQELEKIAENTSITLASRLQTSMTQGGKAADLVAAQLDVAKISLAAFQAEGERTEAVFAGLTLGGGEGFQSVKTAAVGLVQELIAVQQQGAAVLGLDAIKQRLLNDTGAVLDEDIKLIKGFQDVLAKGFDFSGSEFSTDGIIDSKKMAEDIRLLLNSLGESIIRDSSSPFAAAGQKLAQALIEETNKEIATGGDAIAKRFDTIVTQIGLVVAEKLREPINQLREALVAVRDESDSSLTAVVATVQGSMNTLSQLISRGIIPPEQTMSDILVGEFNIALVAAKELTKRATDEVKTFNASLNPQIKLRDKLLALKELDDKQTEKLASLEQAINDKKEEGLELETKKRAAISAQNVLIGTFNQALNAGIAQLGKTFQDVVTAQNAVATSETKLFQLRQGFIDEETQLFTERTAQLAFERDAIAEIRRSIAGIDEEVDVEAIGRQIEELTKKATEAAFNDTAQAAAIQNRIANLNSQLALEKSIGENRISSLQKELELIDKQAEAARNLALNFVKANDKQQGALIDAARLTDQFFGSLRPESLNNNQITSSIQNFLRTSNQDTRGAVIGQLERLKAAGGEIAPGVGAASILREIGDAVGIAIASNPEIDIAERQAEIQKEIVAEQKRLTDIAVSGLRVQTAQLSATQSLAISLAQKAVANSVTGGGTLTDVQRNAQNTRAAVDAANTLLSKEDARTKKLKEEAEVVGRAAVSNARMVDAFEGVSTHSGEASITLEEFRSQMVSLRDALLTAEDGVIEARTGVTEAFNAIGDALRDVTVAQAQFTLGLRKAEQANISAVGGFTVYADELNFLADAFQTQISTLQEVGAAESEIAKLRSDLATQQLSIFQSQIQSIEANAERLLTSASGQQFVEASRAGEIVGQLVRSIGIDPGATPTATQQGQVSDAILSLPLEIRQSLSDAITGGLIPPGQTLGGFGVEELRQIVLGAVAGSGGGTPALQTLQEQAAEQRNIIAENQIQQLEQARIASIASFDTLRTAQEELLAAEAQRDLSQLQLDSLERELPTQTNLLAEIAGDIRLLEGTVRANVSSLAGGGGGPITNAAGGTLTSSEVGGLVRAAGREKRAMPAGSQLGVFNTSETVLTQRQARMLRKGSRIPNAADGFGNVSSDNQAMIASLNQINNRLATISRDDGTRTINLQLDSSRRIRVDGAAGLDTALQDIFSERSAEMFSREEGDAIKQFILGLVQRLRVNGLNLPPSVERGL